MDEFEGRRYTFLLQIRMTGGGLAEGVEIDPEPLWSIALGYRNRDEWQPVLRPLVALNGYRYRVDGAVVTSGGLEFSIRLNLAITEQERSRELMRGNKKGSPILNYTNFAFGFEADSATESAAGQ